VHLGLFYAVVLTILQGSTASGRPLHEVERAVAPRALPSAAYDFQKLYQMLFAIDFHVGIAVYWVVIAVDQGIASQRRAAQLESRLATAQLQALRMQLNPHFLFNTLNAVAALVRKDPEAAEEMVTELGDFLRLTLAGSDAQEVSLREELGFLERYLKIERVRFPDRLTTTVTVEPGTEEARVPSLILQPIVENAIRHGIAGRAEPGRVEVGARRAGDALLLEVRDDGAGLRPERSGPLGEGVGLANTRARLEQLYGRDGRLEIESPEGRGFRVLLRLPFRVRSRDDADAPPAGRA
jgi:LytS/YehU family sensor histidine kinase